MTPQEIVSVAHEAPPDAPEADDLTEDQIRDALEALNAQTRAQSARPESAFSMFRTAEERRTYLGRLFRLNGVVNKRITFEVNLLDIAEMYSRLYGRDQAYILNMARSFDPKAFIEGFDLGVVTELYEDEYLCIDCGTLLIGDELMAATRTCDDCMTATWEEEADAERHSASLVEPATDDPTVPFSSGFAAYDPEL